MAGADEDAGLSCGPAGPRVQRAGALLTPGGAGKAAATCVFIPSSQSTRMCVPCPLVWLASHSTNTPSPNHCEAVSPKALIRGADTLGRAHTHQHACTHTRVHAHAHRGAHTCAQAHLKQPRWYSLPSARWRCMRCTCCPQTPQLLLREPPAAWPWGVGAAELPAPPPTCSPPSCPGAGRSQFADRGPGAGSRLDSFKVSSLAQGEGGWGLMLGGPEDQDRFQHLPLPPQGAEMQPNSSAPGGEAWSGHHSPFRVHLILQGWPGGKGHTARPPGPPGGGGAEVKQLLAACWACRASLASMYPSVGWHHTPTITQH